MASSYPAHLLVVCHGLWGTRAHVAYICKSALENATTTDLTPHRLVVLPASLNENTHTYDGIDVCAERVVKEIDLQIKRVEEDGGIVRRFSIVGYSLGGLVARYVLGLLESRTPSFFSLVEPVNFTTFASPAIGIPRYKSFWSEALRFLGARMLSRSGSQLYEVDHFLPSSLLSGNNQPVKPKVGLSLFTDQREKAEPLLAVMADPRYSFFRALLAFERVEIFANSINDRTVPYPTGAIEAHDPFALARARARKAAIARGDDPDAHEPDILEGGLEIKLVAGAGPLIESYREVPVVEKTPAVTPKRWFKVSLPLLLRPTTYPFSRPVSLLVIFLLPVALPAALLFLVGKFLLAGRQSKRRISEIRRGMGGGREGMLERVGVRLREAIDDVAETVQPDNPEHAVEVGDGGSSEDVSSTAETLRNEETPLRHPAFAAFSKYDGTDTPPLARPVSPGELEFHEAAPGAAAHPFSTDPVLSPAQVIMIRNLNSIPQLRKHLAFSHARNSHGMLVCRDSKFPQHREEGAKVVDFWAREFKL